MGWEVLWGPAARLAAREHQPSSGSFSAVAAALQLEFIPEENNEEVPRLRPPRPWRLQREMAPAGRAPSFQLLEADRLGNPRAPASTAQPVCRQPPPRARLPN